MLLLHLKICAIRCRTSAAVAKAHLTAVIPVLIVFLFIHRFLDKDFRRTFGRGFERLINAGIIEDQDRGIGGQDIDRKRGISDSVQSGAAG